MEFYDGYEKTIRDNTAQFLSAGYHKEVMAEMHETRGSSLSNFLSHPVFCSMLASETKKLHEPTIKLLDQVHKYLSNSIVGIQL